MDAANATALNPDVSALLLRLCEAQEETNRLLKNERKEWLSANETAELLGKTVTKSGWHLRSLKFARDKGHLTVYGRINPYTYHRTEVEALKRKIVAGDVYLP